MKIQPDDPQRAMKLAILLEIEDHLAQFPVEEFSNSPVSEPIKTFGGKVWHTGPRGVIFKLVLKENK